MKLYDFPGAPNPRRVKIFAAEKGIALELVKVDLARREHKKPEFLSKSPSGKIPVLELEDGRCIAETVAICRLLEAHEPEPNLFGQDPYETAVIEMHHRRIELELAIAIGTSWVNGPIVARMGIVEPIEAAKARSDAWARECYRTLDAELGERAFVAGDRFTVADISAFCWIDFAGTMVGLEPGGELEHLHGWFERVAGRPSVSESASG